MKKIKTIATAIFLVVALASCSSDDSIPASNNIDFTNKESIEKMITGIWDYTHRKSNGQWVLINEGQAQTYVFKANQTYILFQDLKDEAYSKETTGTYKVIVTPGEDAKIKFYTTEGESESADLYLTNYEYGRLDVYRKFFGRIESQYKKR